MYRGMSKWSRDILHLLNALLLLQPKPRAWQKTTEMPEDGFIFARTWRFGEAMAESFIWSSFLMKIVWCFHV